MLRRSQSTYWYYSPNPKYNEQDVYVEPFPVPVPCTFIGMSPSSMIAICMCLPCSCCSCCEATKMTLTRAPTAYSPSIYIDEAVVLESFRCLASQMSGPTPGVSYNPGGFQDITQIWSICMTRRAGGGWMQSHIFKWLECLVFYYSYSKRKRLFW